MPNPKKALFLDRDGIFNEVVFRNGVMHSPTGWDEVKHLPGLEDLSKIRELGFLLIMVTNQPDIERKIITQAFVEELNCYYVKKYHLDKAYYCPFSSNDHPDKKPNPGMFLKAARDFDIDLSRSFHLGDTDRDLIAAKNCGATPIIWSRPYNLDLLAPHRVQSVGEILAFL